MYCHEKELSEWNQKVSHLFSAISKWAMKNTSCLAFFLGFYYTAILGSIVNHYKDPYETTSIMESKSFFFWSWLTWIICDLVPETNVVNSSLKPGKKSRDYTLNLPSTQEGQGQLMV